MSGKFAVGIDIGGTKMAFALVDEQGHIHAEHRLPTHPESGVEAVIDAITAGVHTVRGNQAIEGVGIGIPGYVDPVNGVVMEAVNLGWLNVPLAHLLSERLSLRVSVQKDVNAALLGEVRFGAAKNYRDVILIAVGTGLGVSVMVKGQVTTGADGAAGEPAHVSFNQNGRICRCGLRGCPEAYISGVGLLAGLAEHARGYPDSPLSKPDVSTQQLIEGWHEGDSLAVCVFNEALEHLTQVVLMSVGMLNPQLIILGGGLGLALQEPIIKHLSEQVKLRTHAAAHRSLQFVPSVVASSAVGAAALILS